MDIYRKYEVKDGRTWKETYKTTNELEIYKMFASELYAMKIFKSPIYKRMREYSNYDGTRTVIFYQDIGGQKGKSVYQIKV